MSRLFKPGILVPALVVLLSSTSAHAQFKPFWESWGSSDEDDRPRAKRRPSQGYGYQGSGYVRTYPPSASSRQANIRSAKPPRNDDDDDDDTVQQKPQGPKLLEGGPRPDIDPISPKQTSISLGQPSGTIVIDTKGRQLFLVTGKDSALRYPISVGRDGFTWTGTEKIARIADWPDWHPPAEMRERIPTLPEKMTGGIRNPLGAKSLYLGNSLYRIHGTNDAKTIGQAASSGCFRMLNGHVIDLGNRVGVGTKVVVLSHLGASVARSNAPESTSGSKQSRIAKVRGSAG